MTEAFEGRLRADSRTAGGPLCGDPTCRSFACTQEAIDLWNQRQMSDAHRIVVAEIGFCWRKAGGDGACEVCDARH